MSTDQEHNGGPRVIDKRGTNKNPTAPPAEPAEMTTEDRELLAQQAMADDSTPIQDPDYRPVLTAFLVIVGHGGDVTATSNVEMVNALQLGREAVLADMYSAAAHIMKDVQEQETAVRVLNVMQQQAVQARETMMAERMHQQMAGPRVQPRR